MNTRHAYIFLPTIYTHEEKELVVGGILKSLSGEYSERVRYRLVCKASELIQLDNDAFIVTDALHRLTDGDGHKTAGLIVKLLQDTQRSLWIPGSLDLRAGSNQRDSVLHFCGLMVSSKTEVKSARIRASLFIKTKLNGSIREKNGLTQETKVAVLNELKRNGFQIRATARQFQISPASCHRIAKTFRGDK